MLSTIYCFNPNQPNGQDDSSDPVKVLAAPHQAGFAAIQFYMTVKSAVLEPC